MHKDNTGSSFQVSPEEIVAEVAAAISEAANPAQLAETGCFQLAMDGGGSHIEDEEDADACGAGLAAEMAASGPAASAAELPPHDGGIWPPLPAPPPILASGPMGADLLAAASAAATASGNAWA